MSLPGSLLERIKNAILESFGYDSLAQALKISLDLNLEQHVPRNTPFDNQVFHLIQDSERSNHLLLILNALARARPHSGELAAVCEEVRSRGIEQPMLHLSSARPAEMQASRHWQRRRLWPSVLGIALVLSLGVNLYYLVLPQLQNAGTTTIQSLRPHIQTFEWPEPQGSGAAARLITIPQDGLNHFQFYAYLEPGGTKDHAGFTFIFDEPQDFTVYEAIEISIRLVNSTQVDFVLDGEVQGQRESITLGGEPPLPGVRIQQEDGVHHFTIPLQVFGKMDLHQIRKVTFIVARTVHGDGLHEFTVEGMRLVR